MQNQVYDNLYIENCRPVSGLTAAELRDIPSFAVVEGERERKLVYGGQMCNTPGKGASAVRYILPGVSAGALGDASFCSDYKTDYCYFGGGMANAISSVEMTIALGRAGFMCSYGAGGVSEQELEEAIDKINAALPKKNYMINFLNSNNPAREMALAKLLIRKGVPVIEASAFIELSPALIYYKVSGLRRLADGSVASERKIIAKLSREEVSARFMAPPSAAVVSGLLKEKLITAQQAKMAAEIPLADDITVEADSGGHTDNRPLVALLPAIISQRDKFQQKYKFKKRTRIGAAGGISTPESALAAFQMGAAYVVTGSVNQSCIEAGTSEYVKNTLAQVAMSDVVMAPCADMFEMGAKVQVIKKGTMFPMNAQKLYDLYIKYKSIDDLKDSEIMRLEKMIFKCPVSEVWDEVVSFFEKTDKGQLTLMEKNGKVKMAMIFRWYLGKSSKWAVDGLDARKMDMQIWCGQAMGAFNTWCKGTPLEKPENRRVADIAGLIMDGAAYLQLRNMAEAAGVEAGSMPELTL